MKVKRVNPWPTPEQELQRLAATVGGVVCGKLLWDGLSDAQQARLGGDFLPAFTRFGGTIGLFREVSGMPPRRAILDVALRLNLLDPHNHARLSDRLGEGGTTLEARVRNGVLKCPLVLVPEQRVFFFDGTRVDLSTRPVEWKFVELLAKNASRRRPLDAEDVSEGVQSGVYLSKLLSRMSSRPGFPPGFCDLIRSPNRDGRLVLELDADQICVISTDG